MARPLRALGYARVSSAEQALGTSLQDQQKVIAAEAKSRGLDVAECYVESESAGEEKLERREEIQRLLRDVRRGDLVLVDKADRWSRFTEFTMRSVREIHEAGADIYFVGERLDPRTPEGKLMMGFRAVISEDERNRIRIRTVGTRKLLRDRGLYVEGNAPFGYRRPELNEKDPIRKNTLLVHPEEAAIVRRIFQLCIQGWPVSKIAADVGLKIGRVSDAIHRRVHTGEVQNSRGEWIAAKHEAIVDADTFARAQAALAGRHYGPMPGTGDAETRDWILREVARCGKCGARMSAAYGPKGQARRYYYVCSKRSASPRCPSSYIYVPDVEAEAVPLIVGRLEELRAELAAPPKVEKAKAPSNLDERRAKLQRRREKHLEAHAAELMSLDELRIALSKLDAERLKIDGEEQAARKPSPLASPASRRALLGKVGVIRKAWGKATPEEKRAIVGHLAHGAKMTKGEPVVFMWRTAEELAADV